MSGFCQSCGAGKPPRYGEGRCPECAPFACWWHRFKMWLVGL